jgi:hypothetical protein
VAVGRLDDARSGGLSDVAMMQATDFGNLNDPAELRGLDWPSVGWILVERKMRASPMVVREVARQDAPQVAFVQDEDVIQALAPDRANEPFREGVLQSRQLQLIR